MWIGVLLNLNLFLDITNNLNNSFLTTIYAFLMNIWNIFRQSGALFADDYWNKNLR